MKSIITWCLSSLNNLPFTVCVIVIQWIIGNLTFNLLILYYTYIYYKNVLYVIKLNAYIVNV